MIGVTGSHSEDSRQILKDVTSLLGIDANDVAIVEETFSDTVYRVILTMTTVGYIKRGNSTILLDQKSVMADVIKRGIEAALCSAHEDPRPTPRRFR